GTERRDTRRGPDASSRGGVRRAGRRGRGRHAPRQEDDRRAAGHRLHQQLLPPDGVLHTRRLAGTAHVGEGTPQGRLRRRPVEGRTDPGVGRDGGRTDFSHDCRRRGRRDGLGGGWWRRSGQAHRKVAGPATETTWSRSPWESYLPTW